MATDRTSILELALLASGCAAIGVLLDGLPLWLAGIALALLVAWGTFTILARHEPRGVPVEALAPPAVGAVGALGVAHLAGPGLLTVPALAVGAAAMALAVSLEVRTIGPADVIPDRRRDQHALASLVLAFLAFAGIAAAVPGGLVQGATQAPLDGRALLLLVVADAIVAFALGYRLSALRVTSMRSAAVAGGTFAVVVAIAAAAVRALALPRLIGPALLAAVFALWAAYRAAPGSERRSASWLWEYGVLALAAAATVAWNLLVR